MDNHKENLSRYSSIRQKLARRKHCTVANLEDTNCNRGTVDVKTCAKPNGVRSFFIRGNVRPFTAPFSNNVHGSSRKTQVERSAKSLLKQKLFGDIRVRSDSFRSEPRSRTHTFSNAAQQKKEQKESNLARRERLRATLVRVLRLTCLLSKVCSQMRQVSMRKTQQARGSDLYYYNASGTADDEQTTGGQLAFDKALFSRDKGSKLPLSVRLVANKDPSTRTDRDLKLMYRVLNSMRSFKERLTTTMKWKICQYASYIGCERGRVVLREGHHGESFYFIYSGSVFVQLETKDPITGKPASSVENVIHRGASFGELALLGNNGRRTATVVCREPTELFMIDKTAFIEAFHDIFHMELKLKIGIANSLPLFHGWSPLTVESLCFQSQLMTVPHGKVLSPDWAKAQHVYYVLKGKVLLMRELNCHHSYSGHHQTSTIARTLQRTRAYLSVGFLEEGDISDCRILSTSEQLCQGIGKVIMISQGATLVRFSQKVVESLAPTNLLQHYLEEQYAPRDISNEAMMHKVYEQTAAWKRYKVSVIKNRIRPQTARTTRTSAYYM